MIYQGSFYYHSYNFSQLILRYDLHLKKIVANYTIDINSNDTDPKKCRVYSVHREHVGCYDFSVDENGLWVVYRNGSRRFIYVSKLNLEDLSIQKTVKIEFFAERYNYWIEKYELTSTTTSASNSTSSKPRVSSNSTSVSSTASSNSTSASTTVSSNSTTASSSNSTTSTPIKKNNETESDRDRGYILVKPPSRSTREYDEILNGVVICGKIYFLQYHPSFNTTIRFVFDLYNMDQFNYLQSIQFIQPFWKNTQLTYNPFDMKIYAWDSDYLLTYSLDLIRDEF